MHVSWIKTTTQLLGHLHLTAVLTRMIVTLNGTPSAPLVFSQQIPPRLRTKHDNW